jgi:Flp pilus assembly protein TadG
MIALNHNLINEKQHKRNTSRPGGSEAGTALVETALVFPILILLLAGAAAIAQATYAAIEVSNAARAGVAYGAQSVSQSADTTGIQTAAANDAGDLSATLTTTPTVTGICSSGNSCTGANSTCTNSDCTTVPGDHIEWTLTVKTSAKFNPVIPVPGISGSLTLKGQAVQKVLPQ